jgi:two-component system, cell cycle response regulator
MSEKPVRVLLIEDNPLDEELVRSVVRRSALPTEVVVANRLSVALERLSSESFDIVLLDLFLGDALGLDALRQAVARAPETPILALTRRANQTIALEAVRAGAQDYLAKDGMDGEMVGRAIRYAIERNRLLADVRAMSLKDELTGLYNRRGFKELAEQQIRVANRTRTPSALFFADLDGLKSINDELGHPVGDEAIRETAELLCRTFRNCDILARLGGDEFVALALNSDEEGAAVILNRMRANVAAVNEVDGREYRLSLSTGFVVYDPAEQPTIDELLARADAAMYEDKRRKAGTRGRSTELPANSNA